MDHIDPYMTHMVGLNIYPSYRPKMLQHMQHMGAVDGQDCHLDFLSSVQISECQSHSFTSKLKKIYTGKRTQTVWGTERIMHDNVDDDDDDHGGDDDDDVNDDDDADDDGDDDDDDDDDDDGHGDHDNDGDDDGDDGDGDGDGDDVDDKAEHEEDNDKVEVNDVEKEEDDDVEEMDEKNDNVAEDEVEDDYVAEDEVEVDDVEFDEVKKDRSQDRGPHFVRDCAVEMHVEISQEPPFTEIYRKNAAPRIEPRTRTHTLCEPAQSKHMPRFHKSHFILKFTRKLPQTKMSPERTRTLCASLHSRNACQA